MYAAMLTRVKVWELKVHNLRLPQMLSLLLLVMLSGQVLLGDGATVTWGHVNKYASLLHTDDVYLPPGSPGRDLIYGSQNASDNYRITGIHVEDLTDGPDGVATASITGGGIGHKFVVLHCQAGQGNITAPGIAHLQVSFYGLDL
ncbi:uncharacterized protein Dana_GF13054 [Drosophila ananassae]|uniref:Uncharacterized protein n=1 Tax=Drosophila ananassae TaxID=7217 RepID=B3MF09_DROAN|nr:uncharacterized protein LOC6495897 [Drosophila ananassae]EDV36630.2 uncharacterized protein Dana_GF13054 [Drosophila ananassae]